MTTRGRRAVGRACDPQLPLAAKLTATMEPLEERRLLATYYVSPMGSDSASGTSTTSPWKTITRVNKQTMKAGDKILFKGGSSFGGSLYFPSKEGGTQSNPITISTYGSGRATINSGTSRGLDVAQTAGFSISNINFKGSGRTSNKNEGIYFHVDVAFPNRTLSGITIKNVDVSGYGKDGIRLMSGIKSSTFNNVTIQHVKVYDNLWSGVKITGQGHATMKNFVIDHVKAYNNTGSRTAGFVTGSGIFIANVNGARISRSLAYNNGQDGAAPVGIWASYAERVTIEYCESYNNKTYTSTDGGGFDFDWSVNNSVMQYNYSHGNAGPGFILAAGKYTSSNNVVRYNVSENDGRKNGRAGLQIWGDVRNSSIYNNVVYITYAGSSNTAALYAHDLGANGLTPQNLLVRNNIFYTMGGVKLINLTGGVASKGTIKFTGNAYYSGGSAFKIQWGSTTYTSLDAWRNAKGQERDGSTKTGYVGNPMLNSPGQGGTIGNADYLKNLSVYRLKSGSPLINRGVSQPGTLSAATKDFYGGTTPKGGRYDIGVNEYA